MQIDAESLDGNVRKIKLAGRMDVQGAHEIDLKFSSFAANQTAVIVDMSAVEFLSSIGIRTFVCISTYITRRCFAVYTLKTIQ
jgi:anti-anti-sigma factor